MQVWNYGHIQRASCFKETNTDASCRRIKQEKLSHCADQKVSPCADQKVPLMCDVHKSALSHVYQLYLTGKIQKIKTDSN